LSLHDVSWNHFHNITARTGNVVGIHLDNHELLGLLNFCRLLRSKVLFNLKLSNLELTVWTLNRLVFGQKFDGVFPQTLNVNLMPTLSALDEGLIVVNLIVLGDLFIAELAGPVLYLFLDFFVVGHSSIPFHGVHKVLHVHSLDLGFRLLHIRRSKLNCLF
jgi:hypothetical protein